MLNKLITRYMKMFIGRTCILKRRNLLYVFQ